MSIPDWLAKARGWQPSGDGSPDEVISDPLIQAALAAFGGRIVSIRDATQKAAKVRPKHPGWSVGRRLPCPSCGAYPYTRPAGQTITRRCHSCGREWNPEA